MATVDQLHVMLHSLSSGKAEAGSAGEQPAEE
jgi:hypothetical protein